MRMRMRMESLEKGGGGRIKGGKRGERGEGGWCLVVGYLPNLYLSPSYTL